MIRRGNWVREEALSACKGLLGPGLGRLILFQDNKSRQQSYFILPSSHSAVD